MTRPSAATDDTKRGHASASCGDQSREPLCGPARVFVNDERPRLRAERRDADLACHELETVTGELKIVDDVAPQRPGAVRQDRRAEPRRDLGGLGAAADRVARLEHQRLQTRLWRDTRRRSGR